METTGGFITKMVIRYFTNEFDPLPPSKIDEIMGLESGKAHDIICDYWAWLTDDMKKVDGFEQF